MIPIRLGKNCDDQTNVYVDPELLRTHLHLIGATGAGKTTAIQTILRPLMLEPRNRCCLFVIDPMGNLSTDLLRFIANKRLCPEHVRRRLVYIEPARKDVVLPFNPLIYCDETDRYYQTMRAVDLVLRAWASQDVAQQPRLLQWTYKAFCAAAMLGFPIAMCRFLVHPGTDEHKAMLKHIPVEIASHWSEILNAKGSEPTRILESTRNRLDPFFECAPLRRMFSCQRSSFNCEHFIRERRIVILNVAKYGRIPPLVANTIGALALNEILETATRLATTAGRGVVDPTYILMDEFQRFVSVDVEDALPTVRQMGLRLLLAHQSFSQLERRDVDLTNMVWQARSRLIFANSARDADLLADELAKRTFNPKRIKDKRETIRQLIVGYRKEWLESVSETSNRSRSAQTARTTGFNNNRSRSDAPESLRPTITDGTGSQSGQTSSETLADSDGSTRGKSQANVPIHKTFRELSSVTFQNFEEFSIEWGQDIRELDTGLAFLMSPGKRPIPKVAIDQIPIRETAQDADAIENLKQQSFGSEFFISAAEADREDERQRLELLRGQGPSLPPPRDDPDFPFHS